MPAVSEPSVIRHDLFAIKTYEDCGKGGAWVLKAICTSIDAAWAARRFIDSNRHRDYPLMRSKIVHPSQRLVDVFLAYGNTIQA